ncbi:MULTISPECIES: hypothetical protein [Pandoraea]|uniref:Uncharacterized protein n=1 Tax=Pandoraea cepalis TaxID=2508294 RepID=A0A5E4X5D3_9BURK|nr:MULTISPECIES: hypothetical protein [Pandoraea]VVE31547.1 hypothetical protein PCE31107_03682 [Pandoraea cepalis]
MGNLFDEYPALLVLPEVLLAIAIVAAIVVMRRKPSPQRRVRQMRAIRPMPSDTVDPVDSRDRDAAAGAADDPLKREDWSDDRR